MNGWLVGLVRWGWAGTPSRECTRATGRLKKSERWPAGDSMRAGDVSAMLC